MDSFENQMKDAIISVTHNLVEVRWDHDPQKFTSEKLIISERLRRFQKKYSYRQRIYSMAKHQGLLAENKACSTTTISTSISSPCWPYHIVPNFSRASTRSLPPQIHRVLEHGQIETETL